MEQVNCKFGAAKAAAGQACGALELNSLAAQNWYAWVWRRSSDAEASLCRPGMELSGGANLLFPWLAPHLQNFALFLRLFLCIFSAFYAFPRKDLSLCKFHPFPCQNRSPSPCYTEHSSEESPAGAEADEPNPVKIQIVNTYRKQEVTHELLR